MQHEYSKKECDITFALSKNGTKSTSYHYTVPSNSIMSSTNDPELKHIRIFGYITTLREFGSQVPRKLKTSSLFLTIKKYMNPI